MGVVGTAPGGKVTAEGLHADVIKKGVTVAIKRGGREVLKVGPGTYDGGWKLVGHDQRFLRWDSPDAHSAETAVTRNLTDGEYYIVAVASGFCSGQRTTASITLNGQNIGTAFSEWTGGGYYAMYASRQVTIKGTQTLKVSVRESTTGTKSRTVFYAVFRVGG